jgi:hypothetical protein
MSDVVFPIHFHTLDITFRAKIILILADPKSRDNSNSAIVLNSKIK